MPKILLFMLLLTGFAMTFSAQADLQAQTDDKELKKNFLYQWTDEKGIVHIADGLDKVPKNSRDKALKLKQPKKEDADQGQQVQQEQSDSSEVSADDETKAVWQQRMRKAKQRLEKAESRYQELGQRRDELLGSWGGPASGHYAERIEADKVEQEMKGVQQEIDGERHNVDVVIPEEARKAGVPPGWLRE